MKMSTRARYGIRFMFELALHYGKGPIILKDIARDEEISEKYLSHLVIPLKGVGLIQGSRGAHGGYTLARHPSGITCREIVEILEGDLNVVECTKRPGVCRRSSFCVSRSIWAALKTRIAGTLEGFTLEDLVAMHKQKRESLVYSI